MDCGGRIMHQINVLTTLAIVRFLAVAFEDSLNPLDTYAMACLLAALTYVTAQENVLCQLSRRLAILLIVEKLRPLILTAVEGRSTGVVHIQTLMVNAAVVSALAVIPSEFRRSPEGAVMVSSVQNLYGDFMLFALRWEAMHLTLLVLCTVVVSWAHHQMHSDGAVYSTLWEILSMGAISLAIAIVTDGRSQADADILRLLLLFTALHFTPPLALAENVETYLLLHVAGILQAFIVSDHWAWCCFLVVLVQCLRGWVGMGSWVTHTAIMVLVNVAVAYALGRIRHLAMYDTFITLKVCAVVLQLITHELSRLTVVAC
jgi:hypothetical protein